MILKKRLLSVLSVSFLAASVFGVTSCGGGNDTDDTDPLQGLKDDVVYDDDGNVEFDNVELTMWSIIGSPDDVTFDKLIKQFNDEYMGRINISVKHIGHYDYYSSLENAWQNEKESLPDISFMHNEKTAEYAHKGYLFQLNDTLLEKVKCKIDFTQAYENIDRVTKYNGVRYAVPVDAHGFVTSIRQDIIKKNGLGFDNNTRFIPKSYDEYNTLLTSLRKKADSSEGLLVRNLNKGENHAWHKVDANAFRPSFTQSTDPDGLSALYANGGSMMNDDQTKITFADNEGFVKYCTDQVERWNNKLIGETSTSTAGFAAGTTVLFSEGPWWVASTYDPSYNNSELLKVNAELGVTQDDVDNYGTPYVASRPDGWWTIDANKSSTTANKWYGNGHAISLTKHVDTLTKVAAAVEFMDWYTQGKMNDKYNLATWCTAGHIPAWKNVYASSEYKAAEAKSKVLQALGSPEDIIAMEGLKYETTVFTAVANCVSQVQSGLKGSGAYSVEDAKKAIQDVVSSAQAAVDLLQLQDEA